MFSKVLLTALLSIGLHANACTGGVFALLTSSVDSLTTLQPSNLAMSYGSVGYLSCKKSERSTESSVGALDVSGCGDTETCLTTTSTSLKEPSLFVVSKIIAHIPEAIARSNRITEAARRPLLARAGPIYPDPHTLTKSLIKLE